MRSAPYEILVLCPRLEHDTRFPGENGKRSRLRPCGRKTCGFDSHGKYQSICHHGSVRLRLRYLIVAVAIFILLGLIETQFDTGFVRHSVGDALVVVLVYAIIMTFSVWSRMTCAIVSLLIAYAVEASQALDLVGRFGVTRNRLTDIVLGNTFTWSDIVAYTVGIAIALIAEAMIVSFTTTARGGAAG